MQYIYQKKKSNNYCRQIIALKLSIVMIVLLFPGCHQNNSELKLLRKIGSWTTTYEVGSVAFNVFIDGDYAYLAFGEAGLQIIDIHDPTNPFLKGSCLTTGPNRDVFIAGNYAFLASSEGGLDIIDISDPGSPFLLNSFDTGGYTFGVTVASGYCYLADGDNGLTIIDISTPSNPIKKGNCTLPISAGDNDVVVSGIYAYFADNSGGLQIINVLNPLSPVICGAYSSNINAYDICYKDSKIFVADYDYGLKIFDVSNNLLPKLMTSYQSNNIGFPHKIFAANEYIFMANLDKLLILNVTNDLPVEEATYIPESGYGIRGVYVVNNYVYVAQAYGEEALVIFTFD